MPDYASPAGAFSGALESFMTQRAAEQMATQREARLAEAQRLENEQARAALEEKRSEAAEKIRVRDYSETEKQIANMVPGDIPDADLVTRARKHHIPLPLATPLTPEMAAATPGAIPKELPGALPGALAAPPDVTGKMPAPVPPPPAAPAPGAPGAAPGGVLKLGPAPGSYLGSPKQRQELEQKAKIQSIIEKMATLDPASADFKRAAVEYEMTTGKAIPAGVFGTGKAAADTPVPVYTKEQALKLGNVPKDAKIIEPKDTSARDAANEARKETQRMTAHQRAVTELDKWALPVENQIKGINDLGTMLNARTPEADTLVAPLVLKATVSGTGSGFRMTRAEIENVVGGRSKWETLKAKLQAWETDPKKALQLTDDQRQQLRDLAKDIRKGARAQMNKINDARDAIDNATTPKEIEKASSKLQKMLTMDEEDEASTFPGGMPAVGSMFQGGKVLAIRPKTK